MICFFSVKPGSLSSLPWLDTKKYSEHLFCPKIILQKHVTHYIRTYFRLLSLFHEVHKLNKYH